MNNKIITDNYLNLQGETILKVQNIILDYFQRLDKMINEGNLDANLCADYLKIIVEAIKVSEKPEVWINNAYTILKQFKTWIECDNKKYHIGLIGGWCDIALSVKRIKIKRYCLVDF